VCLISHIEVNTISELDFFDLLLTMTNHLYHYNKHPCCMSEASFIPVKISLTHIKSKLFIVLSYSVAAWQEA